MSVVPWGKGALSRQGQQRPRVKEAGRRQAARPRAERRPARRGPPRPRRRHGVVARTVRPRLAREGEHALHARRRQLPVLLGTQGARRLQRPGRHASRHSGDVAPAHEQALGARRRAGRKPQARMVARRVRPRLPDGRPRQGEGQAGLLPVLLREEEAREADKARLALGPSARKEWGRRRCLLPIGVILRILDWAAMRGGYGGCIVFDGCVGCGRMEACGWIACGHVPERRALRFNRNGGVAQTSGAA